MSDIKEYINSNRDRVNAVAKSNTSYNQDGKPIIPKDDEWNDEKEWDELFKTLSEEKKNKRQTLTPGV